ncbi:L-asparaginase-like isoform X2 [Haliotis rufescens]|nr:L-asparaginase-like isoform X2 [Haliotis rufescens]XP_046375946.2 L-asparaginase-like isoform X2 [Haliotis rufescens]
MPMTKLRTRETKINNDSLTLDLDVFEFERLIDSSKMNQREWEEIAECIKDNYNEYTGFVVVMGTDTMAYASSALSFMLENLGKPVVFTGAQISIFDARSDGPGNLLCSLIVSTLDIPEVLLCFNKKAFRASRVVKMDCVDFDAYDSPNMPAVVTLDYTGISYNVLVEEKLVLKKPEGPLRVQKMLPKNDVGLLVIFPGMTPQQVKNTVKDLRGVVLLTFGTGNVDNKVVDALIDEEGTEDTKRLFVNVTQCLKGSVTSAYAASKGLKELGVVQGWNMTTEAAFTKLCYVRAKRDAFLNQKKMMEENLRGEMDVIPNENIHNN